MSVSEENKLDRDIFATQIKQARLAHSMTQKELAEKLNVSPTTIISYEKGTKFPNLETAFQISNVLGISLDDMCGNKSKTIEDLGEFILKLGEILKAKAMTVEVVCLGAGSDEPRFLSLNRAFSDFEDKLFDMYNLYTNGTIPEDLFDLWIKNEAKNFKTTNINDEIEEYKEWEAGNPF